jgi:hypothetical protein
VFMGSVVGSEEVVVAAPSGMVVDSSPAKRMLRCRFLRPVSSSPPLGEVFTGEALGSSELSSIGEVSSVLEEAMPEMGPDLEPVPGGGLSDEQREDFNRVYLEMFLDLASC